MMPLAIDQRLKGASSSKSHKAEFTIKYYHATFIDLFSSPCNLSLKI